MKVFTCWYFRYHAMPNGELGDGGLKSKKIKAADIDDAWRRWWAQNPAGDIYRDITAIEDENGVEHPREEFNKDGHGNY